MSRRTTTFLKLCITTALVSVLAIGGTAVAAATYDATNADKVDGRHAVTAGATVTARKGKLVATDATTGRLPNNIIAKAPDADRVDGIHAVKAGSTVTGRKGRLVATDATTGRLPNNIIAKAPDADRLDGRDHTAFAKVDAFYTIYELVPGEAFADAVYAGDWIGGMYCGVGDVAIAVSIFEVPGQAVRGTAVDEDYGIATWDHDAVSSDLDMSLRCLDTNGDGPGPLTSSQSESAGLGEHVAP